MVEKCVGEPSPDRNEYTDIDEAIAKRLQPLRDYMHGEDVLVRALPDVAEGFGEKTDGGDIYFVLSSGAANFDENTGNLVNETWQVTLNIMLPHRYAKKGVYDVFKQARALLIGWKPPYCIKPITAPDWRFSMENGQWLIQATFPFVVYLLDESPDELTTPLIKQMVIVESLGGINNEVNVGGDEG